MDKFYGSSDPNVGRALLLVTLLSPPAKAEVEASFPLLASVQQFQYQGKDRYCPVS